MAGCLQKLLSGPLERDGGISDYAQSLIQDTIQYINQVLREQTRFHFSVVEQTKNKRTISNVLDQHPL